MTGKVLALLLVLALLIFCLPVVVHSEPLIVIDGVKEAGWGTALSTDPLGDMTEPNLDLQGLYVKHDLNNFYIGFDAYASSWGMTYGIYIDTDMIDGSGATTDPWGRAVAAASLHRPEFAIYVWHADTDVLQDAQLNIWDGASWSFDTLISKGGAQAYGAGNDWIEYSIPKLALGSPLQLFLEVFTTGGSGHAQDSVPSDPGVAYTLPDWGGDITILSSFAPAITGTFVIINGGDENNVMTYIPTSDPGSAIILLDSNPGLFLNDVDFVTLNGNNGDDSFYVSSSISPEIRVNGGDGTDSLEVDAKGEPAWNTGTAVVYSSSTGLTPVVFTGMENVTILNSTAVDLTILKSDNPDPVYRPFSLIYTITVTNNGPGDATQVVVTEDLPSGTVFRSADSHGTGSFDSQNNTWTIDSLTNGSSATLDLTVSLDSSIPNGATITNTAGVVCDQYDYDLTNNSAQQATTVDVVKAVGGDVAGVNKFNVMAFWLLPAIGIVLIACSTKRLRSFSIKKEL